VISDTQVTASVPQGAVTGKVGIETQGGTAISSAIFTVTQ
jgi:molybdopterin-binding protein